MGKTEEIDKSKLELKSASKPGGPLEIHSLNNFREVGSYTWIAREITDEMGFPNCVKDTDDCHYCEGQLFVMRHGAEETSQSTDSFGQVLTIINHETRATNIFTRAVHPLDSDEWTPWQMVATGDPKLITENNDINKVLSTLRQQIENDSKRIETAENSLLASATVRFDRIEEDEATINAGKIDSTPTAIVYYKPMNKFVACDNAGNYWDTWDGVEAYMSGGKIRGDKVYLCGDEVYIWMNESLQSATGRTLTDIFIDAKKETVTLSLNKGYIRYENGAIETITTSYSHSEPIFIPKGTLIRLSSVVAASSVAVISQYNNGTHKPLVQGVGNTPKDYSYYISSDANIVFSGVEATLSNLSLISSEVIGDVLDKIEINADVVNSIISTPFVNSGFININDGALVESASYCCTDYILVSDDTYIKTNVTGSAASVAFYDSNKKFISALSNTEINFHETGIPNNAVYFRSSCRKTYSGVMFTSIPSLLSLIGNNDETIKSLAYNVITNGMRYALPQDYDGYLATDCSVTESTAYKHTDYINIKGVKSLTIPSGAIAGEAVSILFDEEKTKVLEIASSMAGTAIEVPGNVVFGRFTFNRNNDTAYIVINEFDKSAVSIKQTADYKPQKSVLFESGVNILSAEMFNISGFLSADGGLNTDSTTYKATDYIRIAQGSYNYSGRVTGSACVHVYNRKKDIIKTITHADTISTFTVPKNGHYIRLSVTVRNQPSFPQIL